MSVYDGNLPTALSSVFPEVNFDPEQFISADKRIKVK